MKTRLYHVTRTAQRMTASSAGLESVRLVFGHSADWCERFGAEDCAATTLELREGLLGTDPSRTVTRGDQVTVTVSRTSPPVVRHAGDCTK